MAAAQNAQAVGGGGDANNGGGGGGTSLLTSLFRGVLIYMLISWLFSGSSPLTGMLGGAGVEETDLGPAVDLPEGTLAPGDSSVGKPVDARRRLADPHPLQNDLGFLPTPSHLLPGGQLPVVNAQTGSLPDLRCTCGYLPVVCGVFVVRARRDTAPVSDACLLTGSLYLSLSLSPGFSFCTSCCSFA
jgi:hypothetical protein